MLSRIFPRQIDNNFQGWRLAVWLFVPVALLKGIQGTSIIFDTRAIAVSADGIPLESYSAASVETILTLFSVLGLYLLLLSLQSIVVLVRYRAMIPFMYLLWLCVQIFGIVLVLIHSIERTGGVSIGVYVNRAILAVTLIGFVLSLLPRRANGTP